MSEELESGRKMDNELLALSKIIRLLAGLTDEERARTLAYLISRYKVDERTT